MEVVLLVEETAVPGGNRSTQRKPQYPEKTRVPRENHRPAVSDWQTLSHNFVSSTPRLELTALVAIGTDYIGLMVQQMITFLITLIVIYINIVYG